MCHRASPRSLTAPTVQLVSPSALRLPSGFITTQRPRQSALGTADRDARDQHGWHADAYGHTLAVFAAGPAAVGELVVRADHGDLGQRLRAIPDQRHALDRGSNLAVLDHVRLSHGEDEVAV